MFLKNPLLLVLSCGFLVSAIPLELTENSASKLSPIPNIVKPIFSSSASIPPLNASAENAFNIRCDGETYGFHPNIVDCEGAKEYLMPDTRTWTFGERHTGLPANVLALPYRIMGDRGLCYVQAVLIGDHTTAKATLSMLRRAAAALVLQCATSLVSQGGIATNIGRSEARPIVHGLVQGHILIFIPWLTPLGGDNNLGVILGKYQIPVSCRGALPSWDSCRDIIYDMPADKVTRVFGPGSDPAVRESLPYSIDSSDLRCSANIFSAGRSDASSFYEIWEAATAVFSVCARHGKTGSIRGLGEHGDMFLTMTTNERLELPNNSSRGIFS